MVRRDSDKMLLAFSKCEMILGDICTDCGSCSCSSFRGGRLSVGGGGGGAAAAAAITTTAAAATALQIRKIIHVYIKRLNRIRCGNPFSHFSIGPHIACPSSVLPFVLARP